MDVKFPDITVQLSGEDGNVFAIIGRVATAIDNAGFTGESIEFRYQAFAAGSYDEVLQLCMKWVNVT